MKNFLKKITMPKKLLAFGAALAATAVLGTAAVATFGPDRPTREWSVNENGFEYVTFNSFTGVPNGIGDERDFLRGVVTGRDANWQDPVVDVANRDTVTAKIYIHNNADSLLNDQPGQPGVAKDVNVKIEIPTGLKSDHEVTSSISASNAQPQVVFDTLDIDSINDSLFQLAYVPGSAKYGGQTLSDAIFTTGIQLDDQKGCFEYVREITFEMQIEKPGYQIQKTARLKGETKDDWRKVVNAERGDTIEWKIYFDNIGTTILEDVTLYDDLPSYSDINEQSVELVNGSNPSGYFFGQDAIQENGDKINVDLGTYGPDSNAFLYYETIIQDHEDIQCGIYQVANVAYVTPAGLGTLNDNAKVNIVNEPCEEEEVVTVCNILTAPTLSLRTGESAVFTAEATAQGTTIEEYEFVVNREIVQKSSSNTYTFTQDAAGEYEVGVAVYFANGARESSTACLKTVTVFEEQEPIYACEMFTLLLNDRTANVSFKATASNGATFKDALIVYTADGLKKSEDLTNKIGNDGVVKSSYTFGNDATNVFAKATVRFNVTNKDGAREIKEVLCQGKAVLSAVSEKCTIPGFTHLPKDSDKCVAPELPKTGAGSTLVITMMAVAGAGSLAHRKRTLARQ